MVPIHDELVRVGPDRDGGYLVPDVFDERCRLLFFSGVADCSEFELNWQTVVSKSLWQINQVQNRLLFVTILTLLNFLVLQIIPLQGN